MVLVKRLLQNETFQWAFKSYEKTWYEKNVMFIRMSALNLDGLFEISPGKFHFNNKSIIYILFGEF